MNNQESSINQKSNNIMSVMFLRELLFLKNFCLVARIVSFDTAVLHLLTFRILEPNTSKNFELRLSNLT